MKAPDKIYASFINNGKVMVGCGICPIINSSEYLRKDALLEWAKETYLNENTSAIRKVCYKQLIDKLNSL